MRSFSIVAMVIILGLFMYKVSVTDDSEPVMPVEVAHVPPIQLEEPTLIMPKSEKIHLIDLKNRKLTSTDFINLNYYPGLTQLNLSGSSFDIHNLLKISKDNKITHLTLDGTLLMDKHVVINLVTSEDSQFINFRHFSNLQTLSVKNSSLSAQSIAFLKGDFYSFEVVTE
ncbi:MAG: hypothetical protein V3V74_07605 [Nitrosomonadaceae bacterium]